MDEFFNMWLMPIIMALAVGIGAGVASYELINIKTLTRIETLEKTCRNINQ